MKKVIALITVLFGLLLPNSVYSATPPFVIDIDYAPSTGFYLERDRADIFNEEHIAPGDSFEYDLWINNLSGYEVYFYLLRIEEGEPSKDLKAFTFSFYDEGSNLIFKKSYEDFLEKSFVAAIPANDSKAYTLKLTFEPWAKNEYQRAEFKAKIFFGVQDEPDTIPDEEKEPLDPDKPEEPDIPNLGESKKKPGRPGITNIPEFIEDLIKTGQDFKIYYLILCFTVTVVMLIIILLQGRKKDGNKNAGSNND